MSGLVHHRNVGTGLLLSVLSVQCLLMVQSIYQSKLYNCIYQGGAGRQALSTSLGLRRSPATGNTASLTHPLTLALPGRLGLLTVPSLTDCPWHLPGCTEAPDCDWNTLEAAVQLLNCS